MKPTICSTLFLYCFGVLVGLAPIQSVIGHPSKHVKSQELHIFRDRIVMFLRYEISETRFTADLRERFDLDARRTLSSDERRLLAEHVLMLAVKDLRLEFDGQELSSSVTLKATSGADHELPSAYPLIFYWQLDFALPIEPRVWPPSDAFLIPPRQHEIAFQDKEARWNSPFNCRVRLAPGVEEAVSNRELSPTIEAARFEKAGSLGQNDERALQGSRSFEFPEGDGSFKLHILIR